MTTSSVTIATSFQISWEFSASIICFKRLSLLLLAISESIGLCITNNIFLSFFLSFFFFHFLPFFLIDFKSDSIRTEAVTIWGQLWGALSEIQLKIQTDQRRYFRYILHPLKRRINSYYTIPITHQMVQYWSPTNRTLQRQTSRLEEVWKYVSRDGQVRQNFNKSNTN